MSGFIGFTGPEKKFIGAVEKMLERISHRGGASDVWSDESIVMGSRYSNENEGADIKRPFQNKNLTLVFDGRIYNRNDISGTPRASDEETIIKLYENCGINLLFELRGMFSFALYDAEKKSIFCARDPFGIKPFYYYLPEGEKGFIFGSEIKCFLGHPSFRPILNETALAEYLSFQYSALTETFYKNCFRLPAGHYLTYGIETGEFDVRRYFDPVFISKETSFGEAVPEIDSAARESIRAHTRGAEFGTLLSGGVDSGYITDCAAEIAAEDGKRLKTFTVGFDNAACNETGFAKELAECVGAEHHVKIITPEEYFGALPRVQYLTDEPLADPAAVALYFACGEAAKHVNTVLSGEGADEFFGGYNIYKEPIDLLPYARLPIGFRRFVSKIAESVPFGFFGKNYFIRAGKPVSERHIGNAKIFSESERKKILRSGIAPDAHGPAEVVKPYYERAKGFDDITKMQYLDIQLWMTGDILLKADRMSAAHSLEIRSPLVDKNIFEIASRLPTRLRVNKEGTKLAFRKAAAIRLPEVSAERKKLGFPVPIRDWLRTEKYYAFAKKYFESEASKKYFNAETLTKLLEEHRSRKRDNGRKIWTVLMFLIWHEQYLDG